MACLRGGEVDTFLCTEAILLRAPNFAHYFPKNTTFFQCSMMIKNYANLEVIPNLRFGMESLVWVSPHPILMNICPNKMHS